MTKNRKNWVRWCWLSLGESVLLLSCAAAFTVGVDPLQIYHPVSTGRPILDVRLQRFYVPGLARTSDYQIAVLGTSMLQNIPNSAVQRLCGGPAVNLCMAGASIHEEAAALALALKHAGTKTVIATLDYNSLSGGPIGQVVGVHLAFPEYLYSGTPFDKGPYLLSWDSLEEAIHVLKGNPDPGETANSDWPWKFPDSMKFQARSAVSGVDPADINKKYKMTNLKLEAMEAAFADNIFPVLADGKGVRIHFVFPPYSILAWHDFAQRGQISVYFAFKKWLIAQSRRYPQFDVVDFQDRADVITNMSRYADVYHSDERMDEEMVQAACHGGQALNDSNFESRTQSLLHLVESTDPARIVKAAAIGEADSSSAITQLPWLPGGRWNKQDALGSHATVTEPRP